MSKLCVLVVLIACAAYALSEDQKMCKVKCEGIACGIPKCEDGEIAEGVTCECCPVCKKSLDIGSQCKKSCRKTTCSPNGICTNVADAESAEPKYECVANDQ